MSEVPFIITITIDLALASYLVIHPAKSIRHIMQITQMAGNFKIFLMIFAIFGFIISWLAEHHAFPFLVRFLGNAYRRIMRNRGKKRRQYKILLEEMQS
jgi:cation-transporting P-type ATPase 13A2